MKRFLTAVSLPCIILLFFIYENLSRTGIRCLFFQLTGLYCPGCGSGRAIRALMEGHIARTFSYNILLLPLGIPALIILVHEYLRLVFPGLHLKPVMIPQKVLAAVTGIIFLFWILRNIPLFSFLAPS